MQRPSCLLLFGLIVLWKVSPSDSVLECAKSEHIFIINHIVIVAIYVYVANYLSDTSWSDVCSTCSSIRSTSLLQLLAIYPRPRCLFWYAEGHWNWYGSQNLSYTYS